MKKKEEEEEKKSKSIKKKKKRRRRESVHLGGEEIPGAFTGRFCHIFLRLDFVLLWLSNYSRYCLHINKLMSLTLDN